MEGQVKAPESLEGQVIGNYRLSRKLGEGGMGAVYEGTHLQIGRRAAIKVLHPELSQNEQVAARFFNEARAVNIVHHPGIVQVYEVGQMPDQTAFIVMEFLEGETLSARVKRAQGPMGTDALRLARQVASALAAAHSKGVVHRDLKPDNVMIVPDQEAPGGERAKLLDFGIAKLLEDTEAADVKTRTGMLLGTPTYMSPEQCRGTGNITEKADVYSLGIMLYQMISGKLPYRAGGAGEVIAHHLFVAPKPLREEAPFVQDGLAALVHRMLSKKAEERPTMTEVTSALEALGAPRANTMVFNVPAVPPERGGVPSTTLEGASGQVSGDSPQSGALTSLPTQLGTQGAAGLRQTGAKNPNQTLSGQKTIARPGGTLSGNLRSPVTTPSGALRTPPPATRPTATAAPAVTAPPSKGLPKLPPTSAPVAPGQNAGALKLGGVVLGIIAAIAVGVYAMGGGGGGRGPEVPVNVPQRELVRWTISSTPPGAKVVRLSDGTVLGQTPFNGEIPKGQGAEELELQLEGFVKKRIVLDRSISTEVTHNLQVIQ